MRLGPLDVVSRRHRLEAVEQARLAEMVLRRPAPGRGRHGERQAAAVQEIQQLDDAGLQRNAGLQSGRRATQPEVLRGTRRC